MTGYKEFHYQKSQFTFILDIHQQDYRCVLKFEDGKAIELGTIDGRTLDTAAAGGFLGLWIGPYAVSSDPTAQNRSIKATLSYQPAE